MDYEYFDNFSEFKEKYPKLAQELLDEVGEGEWQAESLSYFESLSDYAQYELEEGWYSSYSDVFSKDFNGAPKLIDFIDLEALGEALSNTWDDSVHYQFSDDSVISTSYGW